MITPDGGCVNQCTRSFLSPFFNKSGLQCYIEGSKAARPVWKEQLKEYFRAIVDTGTICGAARELHMPWPPLSYQNVYYVSDL